jgi:hypothetical protein
VRKRLAALSGMLILAAAPPFSFGWGREGHEVIASERRITEGKGLAYTE